MVIKPASQDGRVPPSANRRNLNFKHLLLFLIASILVHGLGLLIFALHQRSSVIKREAESKPIEFVVVPEEPEAEPPPETQKRAVENSVAEEDTESEQVESEEVEPEETATAPTPPAPPPAEPAPQPQPAPPAPASQPQPVPAPAASSSQPPFEGLSSSEEGKPEPEPAPPQPTPPTPAPKSEPSTPETSPILSGSDAPVASQPEAEAEAEPDTVATRTLPPDETAPESGSAEDLLGGNYQRTLADGGGDAFFSPEALEYESVLNPSQINALKDIDLGPYFDEVKRRVKSNWNPSYRAEDYTTYLTFDIQKNGQITGLRVTRSSGSPEVDRESLEAVQNSAPFAPLPPDFPLESLGVRFSFNIYIY